MAKFIQAVAWLFSLGQVTLRSAQPNDVAPRCESDSELPGSRALSVLCSMQALTLCLNQSCSAVKLPGIGTFTPAVGSGTRTLGSGGRMSVPRRESPELGNALAADGAFRGEIAYRAKMGTNSMPPPRRSSPP